MKKHLIFIGLVFCVFFLGGCATHLDQAGQFRNKHKEESRGYVGLHPVSPEAIDAIIDIQYGQIVGVIAGLCPEEDHPTPEVNKLADNLIKIETHSNAYWKKMSQELKTAATHGGQVYQYDFDNGSHQRIGFLVLKNGDIVKKIELY